MKKFIVFSFLSLLLCSCSALYYGYLPSTDYKLMKPINTIDLKGKSFNIEFRDIRGNHNRISCSAFPLDRSTEPEGDLGLEYLKQSIIKMIQNSNGKIDSNSPTKLVVELKG